MLSYTMMTDAANPKLVAGTWEQPFEPPQSIPESSDVVIIGGGIVGVSTAYMLAKQGVSVALCEKGHIAGEQSGRNWGWVRQQGRDTRELPMMMESLRIWEGLADELGEDTGFTRGGCLFSAKNEKEVAAFEDWLLIAREHGLDTRVLGNAEMQGLLHGANETWAGGLYTANDGRAEPHKAGPALARAASRHGAHVLTSCAVRGIDIEAGRVAGVVTEHGRIRTSTVLCAAGSWTRRFCGSLGIPLPQLHVRGSVCRTAPGPNLLDGNLFDERFGIRRRQDGGYTLAPGGFLDHPVTPASFRWFFKFLPSLMQEVSIVKLQFGGAFFNELLEPKSWDLDKPTVFEEQRVWNPTPNPRALRKLKKDVAAVFPALADVPVVESWAGMIESTPDVIPVIGETGHLPGFHVATGLSGHGFGIGPGAGKAIAAMLTGTNSNIDLEPLRYGRFFDGSKMEPQGTI